MATLFKIVLAFGCILFLVSNSKAGIPENAVDMLRGNGISSEPQYTFPFHIKEISTTSRFVSIL